jgi:hypothetical protein
MKYSNPRKSFTTDQWPYGKFKTTATFTVETGKNGERVSRVTVNPKNGRENKPKTTTYADQVLIVDGDDGKTYIANLTVWGNISIMQSNLQYQHESLFPGDENYQEIRSLFEGQ